MMFRGDKTNSIVSSKKVYVAIYFLSIVILLGILVFQTSADTLTLSFKSFVKNITQEVVDTNTPVVFKNHELFWESFESEVPLDTVVTKISLHFSVSSSFEDVQVISEETVASTSETASFEDGDLFEDDTKIDFQATTTEEEAEMSTQNFVQDILSNELIHTIHSPLDTPEITFSEDTIATVPEKETELEDAISNTTDDAEFQEETTSADIQVASFEEDSEQVQVYVSEVLPLEVILNETSGTTTDGFENSTLFETLYSLDGLTWNSLGEGNLLVSQDISFFIPELTLEDIPNLRIAVLYSIDDETNSTIQFTQMRLEVECALPEEIPVLLPSTPIDLEPNFENGAIKADAQSENIRAVLIERGGMLELWYGTIDASTKEVLWKQLASDGSLSATSPLAIQERTIFWLDKNQQTLFGFAIDTQSLFGDSLVSNNENILRLQFSKRNAEFSSVQYDSVNNTFEFISLD